MNQEVEKRKEIMDKVISNNELEGFVYTKQELDLFEKWVNGEISTKELELELDKQIQEIVNGA